MKASQCCVVGYVGFLPWASFFPLIQCPETPDLSIKVVNWFVPSFCMQMYQLSSHWLFSSVLARVYLTENSQFEL